MKNVFVGLAALGALGTGARPALADEGRTPDLGGATSWLNSAPLTGESLRGKVVLAGLVVIGVHTPEFSVEKEPANVQDAVRGLEVTYPVALDSDYRIWEAFNNAAPLPARPAGRARRGPHVRDRVPRSGRPGVRVHVRIGDRPMRNLKLEVVQLPVSDVDRAKAFYEGLGWRLDGEFTDGKGWRVVHMTPPGSPASVMFGQGLTTAAPGSVRGTFLVVDDIEAARAELVQHGAVVSAVFHFEGPLRVHGTEGRAPGKHPEGQSYGSWASFSDPDGNSWMVQEVTKRLPGRGHSNLDVATLTELLKETEKSHGAYEATAPKHHWSEWYAAYIVARGQGKTPEEASREAGLHMESRR